MILSSEIFMGLIRFPYAGYCTGNAADKQEQEETETDEAQDFKHGHPSVFNSVSTRWQMRSRLFP